MSLAKIHLSPPNVGLREKQFLDAALESGWVAPKGPHLDQFEAQLGHFYKDRRVLLLNSGTSALHMALILAGVQQGDKVITCSLTFAACANVILYQKAAPVFLDCEDETWNLDPTLLEEYLKSTTVLPKAIIVTHLYGMPAQMDGIKRIASEYGIKLLEDAAEALGSTYYGRQVGQFGDYGVISFNGNKIITTSGGGALICRNCDYEAARHLSTQANTGIHEYEHDQVGYNYRMSNILAALGIAQLQSLNFFMERKRSIFSFYKTHLSEFMTFPEEPGESISNRWLTVGLVKGSKNPELLAGYMNGLNIETRRLWKPLHLHQAYKEFEFIGGETCKRLFERGICLPSGTALSETDQLRVIEAVKEYLIG